jgi:hypothetical protein
MRRDELVDGLEDATNASITLDEDGCVTRVESRAGLSGFALQMQLQRLMSRKQVYTLSHGTLGREGQYSEDGRVVVDLDRIASGSPYPINIGGLCLRESPRGANNLFTVGSVIAHELLGHAVFGLTDKVPFDEEFAMYVENSYYAMRGKSERACYTDVLGR